MAPLGTYAEIEKMPRTSVPPNAHETRNALRDDFTRAHLASSLAGHGAGARRPGDNCGCLGDVSGEGMYLPDTKSKWYSNTVMPSTWAEATHRGLHMLAEDPDCRITYVS